MEQNKASADGSDLRVFYHSDYMVLPTEIDRVVTGLKTSQATVQFRLQKAIPANSVEDQTYALVFGSKTSGKARANAKNVFAFYDDFSNSTLHGWERNWGDWTVKNGTVFGKTSFSPYGKAEVGLYVKGGAEWKDIEVELDMMETGSGVVHPGPFMRAIDPRLRHTTAWWFEYWTNHKECAMRPFVDNKDGLSSLYKSKLPESFVKGRWFHMKYQLQEERISQWVDEVRIQNATVSSEWMIPKGTLGFGCHASDAGSSGCETFYDNVKVRLMVASNPIVSTGPTCRLTLHDDLPVGDKEHPADSCKQILDQNPSTKSGVFWIKTSLEGNQAIPTFCDMGNGGWTLIGKISGRAGNIYHSWLVQNVNTKDLQSPLIESDQKNSYSCLDSRLLAVQHASEVMFSSANNPHGMGSKWVRWELPENREYETWWNHKVGQTNVQRAETSEVVVKAWNGNTKVSFIINTVHTDSIDVFS